FSFIKIIIKHGTQNKHDNTAFYLPDNFEKSCLSGSKIFVLKDVTIGGAFCFKSLLVNMLKLVWFYQSAVFLHRLAVQCYLFMNTFSIFSKNIIHYIVAPS